MIDMPNPTASLYGFQSAPLSQEFTEDFGITAQSPLFTIVTSVASAFVFFAFVIATLTGLWIPFAVVAAFLVAIALYGIFDYLKTKKEADSVRKLLAEHYRDIVIKPAFESTGIKSYKHDAYFLNTLASTGKARFRAEAPDETSGAWCRVYNAEISGGNVNFSYQLVSDYDGELPGTTDEMIRQSRMLVDKT